MEPTVAGGEITRQLQRVLEDREQARRDRVEAADRIRVALRQRAAGATAVELAVRLAAISRGESDDPSPALAEAYRCSCQREQHLALQLDQRLAEHPAWPWLQRVGGVDATLAGRLLACLDATRASTPSAFWAFCGLATVPGVEYRCATCGFSRAVAAGHPAPLRHVGPDGTTRCGGALEVLAGPETGVRAAQPGPRDGRSRFHPEARQACVQIGAALLRAGGAFAGYYRQEKVRLDRTRPHWANGRRHLAALRKMEKLFLAQLWLVWRKALGLPLTRPHRDARWELGHLLDPWDWVDTPRRRWYSSDAAPPALRTD